MLDGHRLQNWRTLKSIRKRTLAGLESLPDQMRSLEPAEDPYPVELSPGLQELIDELTG